MEALQQLLLVDDEPTQRHMMRHFCETLGYEVTEAQNGEEALLHLQRHDAPDFSLIITDVSMPIMDGRELVRHARKTHPSLPIIVVTGNPKDSIALELKELGAQDFLAKPIEQERLKVSIDNALQLTELKQEVTRLKRQVSGSLSFDDLIGADGGLRDSVTMARKFAVSDLPVLITGESGVGKEVFAQAIHGESARAPKPFIAINCGAIPANLVESTLFGHEKGAFTGAIESSLGKFREAQGGTLFLDEIGELPLDAQVKLLRALQQAEVEPVGLGKSVKIDVRIIAATNQDLQQRVAQKGFRDDLFFRLSVLPIELPPLRKRKQDIAALCHYFLKRICAIESKEVKQLSPDARAWIEQHRWPGNVRELENTLSRVALLVEDRVIEDHHMRALAHPIASSKTVSGSSSGVFRHADGRAKTLEEVTLELVRQRLDENGEDVQKAAQSLGIPSSTLYRKIRQWRKDGKL